MVVGGGITGVAAALALARRGKRVRVYEAREIASGASGRNGGFALRGGAMAYDSAREWLGADEAAAYWRLTEAYVDRMAELGGDAFRRTGSLRLAGADERDELRAEYQALREDGFDAEWRDELPTALAGRFPGALFHPDDGVLQPARLVRRLARRRPTRASRSASTIASPTSPSSGPARSSSPRTATRAGCSASWKALIIPTRGQMLATEPLEERLFPLPHYGRHGFDYWHQDADGAVDRRRLSRRRHGLGVHGDGGDDAADPGRARGVRRGAARPSAARSRIAGRASSGSCPT